MAKKKQSGQKAKAKTAKKTSAKKSTRSTGSDRDAGTVIVTGLGSIHMFDLGILTNFARAAAFRNYQVRQADIDFCTALQQLLAASKPSASWITRFPNQKLYRVCSPLRNPLDTAGTFGAGGRCNFGMAQRCPEFQGLKASYGLYASMDARTASIEAASGVTVSNDIIYKISKQDGSPFKLIDYDGVVAFFEGVQTGSAQIVAEAPYYAEWSLQKNPKPSQVLGEWLRRELATDADGLFFSSTKNPAGKNVLIFAANATSLEADYTAIRI
ncbi:MAG: RES family NAD+ phosphorylase [Pseudobdellovibrionaceae bacterium]|nr:RES family NAD+ phosphorylase [Pseudobdellovibrionaceae bacterium]